MATTWSSIVRTGNANKEAVSLVSAQQSNTDGIIGVFFHSRVAALRPILDDILAARYVTPALTTVAQSQERIGQRAAEMLLEQLSSEDGIGGRCAEMPYELKARAST